MNTFMDRVNARVQADRARTNRASPPQPPYPDAGIGALENVANGVPRQTMIGDQPHMLAYINPQEEQALRDMGGTGLPGPDGIPAYWSFTDPSSWGDGQGYTGGSNTGQAVVDTFTSVKDNVTDFFTPTVTNTNTNTNTNTTPVVTTTTDTGTGSNTILQDLTNLVTFAGNKSYVDGKEITVNNLGQNFANFVDNDDNLEYVNNILMDKNTGLEAVGTQAQEAFFNTGEGSQVAIRAADAEAAGVGLSYANGLPVYTDSKGGTHSTQAAAVGQNTNISDEANRVTAINSGIKVITGSGPFREFNYKFEDDSGARYDTPEEAINANTALLSSNTVSAGTDVGTDVGTVNTVGALPSGSNTVTQFFANLLTPFDNQSYVDGNLVYNDAGDFTEDPTAATNQSGFVDPTAGAGSALLTSAYAKIAAGNTADLTEPEQRALYGQRGTVPNAAETLALTENYKASGAVTMTQDMQDEIINDMLSGGATKSQIDEYKERSPVGSDVNPFFDTYDELSGFDKFGRAITNVVNFAINKATYGLIDPAAMKEAQADEFVDAYESEGSTGGQFDWNDPDALDLSPGEEGDANFELLLELSKGEGIEPTLQGVVGEDGETVEGVVSVKNTEDGPVIVEDDAGGATSGIGDGDDKPSSEIVMSLYNRYRKGGSGAGMPPWLRKYASGVSINQLLTKVTINGQEYYKTPTGDYILPEELVGAIKGDVETPETET